MWTPTNVLSAKLESTYNANLGHFCAFEFSMANLTKPKRERTWFKSRGPRSKRQQKFIFLGIVGLRNWKQTLQLQTVIIRSFLSVLSFGSKVGFSLLGLFSLGHWPMRRLLISKSPGLSRPQSPLALWKDSSCRLKSSHSARARDARERGVGEGEEEGEGEGERERERGKELEAIE